MHSSQSPAYHSSIRRDIAHLVRRSETLLDVGGGTGATARFLRDEGLANEISVMDAIVADHAEGLASWSAANLDDHAAVEEYLERSGPFDTILLLDVLEHLVDPWIAVDLFKRALTPGGVLIASIPNVRHISVSGKLFFGNSWTYSDAGLLDRTHLRFFVRDTATALVDRPGLTVEKVEPSPIGRRKHRVLDALTLGLLRSLFTLQYFIVARRDD